MREELCVAPDPDILCAQDYYVEGSHPTPETHIETSQYIDCPPPSVSAVLHGTMSRRGTA